MNSKPSISVVIPTLNRTESLHKTIECLFKSTVKDFECIIVDQTPSVNVKKTAIDDIRIKHTFQSIPSLPLARNTGIKLADADIILFLDDDIEFGANLLYEHICAHVRNSSVAAVTGRIKLLPPHFYTGGNVLAKVDENSAKFIVNFDTEKQQESDFISGGNVSIKKRVFSEVGLFDTRFRGNALYEEIDMSMKIRRAGKTILFHPPAEITHLRAEEGGCRTSNKIKWGVDKFYNTGLFYGRWLFKGSPAKFIKSMKDEIEFMTRKGRQRMWGQVAVYFLSLFHGFLTGVLTRVR